MNESAVGWIGVVVVGGGGVVACVEVLVSISTMY